MVRLSPCLRWIFVFFNVLFAIFGVVLFSLGVFTQFYVNQTEQVRDAVHILYTCGTITFLLSSLGVYGAIKEKRYSLITFAVFMLLALLFLLIIAVPKAVALPEELSSFEDDLSSMSPLNTGSQYFQLAMNTFQSQVGCCGLFKGYEDWGGSIPASCECAPEPDYNYPRRCEQVTEQTYFLINERVRSVYTQPCGPLMMVYVRQAWITALGVVFGFAGLAFLGALLSLTMAFQITPPFKKQQQIFTFSDLPPKYSELVNVS